MTTDKPSVTVTDADKRAADAFWVEYGPFAWGTIAILSEAFARHRQAAEAEAKAREADLESLLREAAIGLACLSFKPLDTDIAQAAPLVARINSALAKGAA